MQQTIKNVDSAISKGAVPENITAYRGFTNEELSDIIINKSPGIVVFLEQGFLSTSLSREYCESLEFDGQKIIMELKIRKGTKAASMGMNEMGEYEVLVKRNSTLAITSRKITGELLF